MIAPARSAAFHALRTVTTTRADLPTALARARRRLADPRDRALTADIVSGTLRWRAALDYLVAHFAGRSTDRLDPEVLDILRLSAYQVLHLDRVPPSAAVNDGVDLTKHVGRGRAAGLVNAVLRAIAAARDAPPLPPPPERDLLEAHMSQPFARWPAALRHAALEFLSVTASHPRWLLERWLDRYGYESTRAWTTFNNTPPAISLRANRLRTSAERLAEDLATERVRLRPSSCAPDGLVVEDGNPLHTSLADAGLFLIQDEASQLVTLLADAHPGTRVLDTCASPGGKATAMAADMDNRGLLVATDIRTARVSLLAETVARVGATVVRIVRSDWLTSTPFRPVFDVVLVDAPCTGLGTIRRDPEIRWRREPRDPARMGALQIALLHHAADAVRPGGRLVYATCSSEPEENEQVATAFLEDHREFAAVGSTDPMDLHPALRAVVDLAGCLRTTPFEHRLDAFFAVRFMRQ